MQRQTREIAKYKLTRTEKRMESNIGTDNYHLEEQP